MIARLRSTHELVEAYHPILSARGEDEDANGIPVAFIHLQLNPSLELAQDKPEPLRRSLRNSLSTLRYIASQGSNCSTRKLVYHCWYIPFYSSMVPGSSGLESSVADLDWPESYYATLVIFSMKCKMVFSKELVIPGKRSMVLLVKNFKKTRRRRNQRRNRRSLGSPKSINRRMTMTRRRSSTYPAPPAILKTPPVIQPTPTVLPR